MGSLDNIGSKWMVIRSDVDKESKEQEILAISKDGETIMYKPRVEVDIALHYKQKCQEIYTEFHYLFEAVDSHFKDINDLSNRLLTMMESDEVKEYAGEKGMAVSKKAISNIYKALSRKIDKLRPAILIHEQRAKQARLYVKVNKSGVLPDMCVEADGSGCVARNNHLATPSETPKAG